MEIELKTLDDVIVAALLGGRQFPCPNCGAKVWDDDPECPYCDHHLGGVPK